MTAVDLDALDKLRGAVTPGPWRPHGEALIVDERGVCLIATQVDKDDAALIVAAVNALPDLIAEARKYRALREAVEDAERYAAENSEPGDPLTAMVQTSTLRAVVATVDGEQ